MISEPTLDLVVATLRNIVNRAFEPLSAKDQLECHVAGAKTALAAIEVEQERNQQG